MTAEITVDLPLEKAHQHLLKYFETRDDIKVKSSEPNSVEVRSSGWRPPPWVNIEIGVFGEDNRTRLDFNFDFRIAYATITIAVVMGIAILWVAALMRPENAGYAIGAIIGIMVTIPISFALEISKAERSFLDDIRKAFDLPNKTD
jgi:hypothetical protein